MWEDVVETWLIRGTDIPQLRKVPMHAACSGSTGQASGK